MKAQITALDYHLPEKVLDNETLAERFPEWQAAQIEEKTGIRTRHIAAEDETSADLAFAAAQKLFARGACQPAEIDFILFCSQTQDYIMPSTACLLQDRLGIPQTAGALDINLGCSAFIYGLSVAKGLIESGSASKVLLLNAETYSKIMAPQDKSVQTLFGDGAAATLVSAVELPAGAPDPLGPFVFGTDGAGEKIINIRAGMMRQREAGAPLPPAEGEAERFGDQYLFMNGPAVFTFTLKAVPAAVKALLAKSGLEMEAIDMFVFHQANKFMIDAIRRQLRIPPEKFVIDMQDKGNTVSATIPISIVDVTAEGRVPAGARVMLVGFGVGLSWGACLAQATWVKA
ncbi:MAG: ketoacyl-ACP synthase III [Anaerolineae bacterium]|nr:ketoacyl-ACP synthase III [Anaerolineae bacterium]